MTWNLFPFKDDFGFGKVQKLQGAKSGLQRGWITWMIWCFTKNSAWDMRYEQAHSRDEAASHQLPIAPAFWITWIVYTVECLIQCLCSSNALFKLNEKFDADPLLYSLSHFECDCHTVHMLSQQCLPPPLTSTVKSYLFTHAHSSPLSLAARLHWCSANCFHYINNGWPFSGQASHRQTLGRMWDLPWA